MAIRHSSSTASPRRRRLGIRLLASAAVLTLASGAWSSATWSALSDSSVTPANTVTAGSVDLSDNDSGGGLLALGSARPNDSVTGCIRVTYSGSAPAKVRIFGAPGGTGLASYLDLVVTRGTVSAAAGFGSCTTFTPDATNYLGSGAGVIYTGTVAGFPAAGAGALVDPSASGATWNTGDVHSYRFSATLRNDPNAQGKTASPSFTWEATSL
ncbi:MAG TPA: hypothetical protein VK486_01640 [Thermoleophilaceae bacterium]|nr:hypothetical protein [Thermoleophilaceae bacterium]